MLTKQLTALNTSVFFKSGKEQAFKAITKLFSISSLATLIIGLVTGFSVDLFTPEARYFFGLDSPTITPSDYNPKILPGTTKTIQLKTIPETDISKRLTCTIETNIDIQDFSVKTAKDCTDITISLPELPLYRESDSTPLSETIFGEVKIHIEDSEGKLSGEYVLHPQILGDIQGKISLSSFWTQVGKPITATFKSPLKKIPPDWTVQWNPALGTIIEKGKNDLSVKVRSKWDGQNDTSNLSLYIFGPSGETLFFKTTNIGIK